jgi:SAM-dependent methyltransferase
VTLPGPAEPDALRPALPEALEAWARRVRADREQVSRCREVEDPSDFYAPVADRFRFDPGRVGDAVLDALLAQARPGDRWLDIGAGAGRYALPLALAVREVVALDPSPAMLAVLEEAMREHDIGNVALVEARWPPASPASEPHAIRAADVVLMAHVGYDIEAIGPFLDVAEAVARRRCVAIMGEGAMTTAATLLWGPVHAEPRVALPALPELLTLLLARGCLPEVTLAPRAASTFESFDDLLAMTRRQLWVRPGSARDARLRDLVEERATRRDEGWALDWSETRIGVVSWDPPGSRGDPGAQPTG